MIICSCKGISDRDVHAAIDWMRASDPQTLITPGKVYKALGQAPECGSCIALFIATMRSNESLHVPRLVSDDVPDALRVMRVTVED